MLRLWGWNKRPRRACAPNQWRGVTCGLPPLASRRYSPFAIATSPRLSLSWVSQGQIRLWVDILTPDEAARYPAIPIRPPQPLPFEVSRVNAFRLKCELPSIQVRVIIWKTRKVVSGDATGLNGKTMLTLDTWVRQASNIRAQICT